MKGVGSTELVIWGARKKIATGSREHLKITKWSKDQRKSGEQGADRNEKGTMKMGKEEGEAKKRGEGSVR